MENPFKKLGHPPKEVPANLKKKVMDDVKAFKFFYELISLFTVNYTEAAEAFFKKRRDRNDN